MTIFVDMDEVLADTYGKHIELYNKEFNTNLKREECLQGEVYENVPPEHRAAVHQHVWNEGFFGSLNPIPHSIEVMKELSKKHEVYIASAAMEFPLSLKEKSDWLDEHFPFITWEHRILCGHKFILRGDLLIDDRPYNLETFHGNTLLFNSPHNFSEDRFKRVYDWNQIASILL